MRASILHWFLEAAIIHTSVRFDLLPWVLPHWQLKVMSTAAQLVLTLHTLERFAFLLPSFLPSFLPSLSSLLVIILNAFNKQKNWEHSGRKNSLV